MEDGNAAVSTTASKIIDFTRITSKKYREWYKHYLWYSDAGLYHKMHMMSSMVLFLNYIYDIKHGKQLSVYAKKTNSECITLGEALAYKNHILNTKDNNRTRNGYIYNARALLKHVSDHNLCTIESGIFYHLSFTLSHEYSNSAPISDDNLKKLATFMKHDAEGSVTHAVYYSIFYIDSTAETP